MALPGSSWKQEGGSMAILAQEWLQAGYSMNRGKLDGAGLTKTWSGQSSGGFFHRSGLEGELVLVV